MEKIICVSGYFNPLHAGHIEYFEKSKKLGDKLVVIVNNDKQSILKKGSSFMPEDERLKIIRSLKIVDMAVLSIDDDRTVCKTLTSIRPNIFTNGGDQFNDIIPEKTICENLGIELVDGLGEKIQSSSWLLEKSKIK
jgi:glycerol-3-phosphate cytidylyltransferase/D-beta-D-heptose 7-phosphate kinase/D-beta-D-heptose 1-phosphate adenosyltransferase